MAANHLIKKMYEKKYYVYTHSLDGVLSYIGKGQGTRCLEFYRRSDNWNKYIREKQKNIYDVSVEIVGQFEDELEALKFESNLIISHSSNESEIVTLESKVNLVNIVKYNRKFNLGNRTKKYNVETLNSNSLRLVENYVGRYLTAREKNELCLKLDIRNRNNHIFKWNKIKRLLTEKGYQIEETKKRIDGKQVRLSKIMKT